MDHAYMFKDGSKDSNVSFSKEDDKTAATFVCPSFEFSKRLPDKSSIFTSELESIMSALRYIKCMPTTKSNTIVIFGDSKSALRLCCLKWDHPIVQSIMRF